MYLYTKFLSHKHDCDKEKQDVYEKQMICLQPSRIIASQVPGLSFVPKIIHPEYESYLIKHIDKHKWYDSALRRRIQEYGYSYDYFAKKIKGIKPPFPDFIHHLCQLLVDSKYIPYLPDQLVINEYLYGQNLSKHTDGMEFGPLIFTLSLGSPCQMIFRCHSKAHTFIISNCSLLKMEDEARYHWTHEVSPLEPFQTKKLRLRRVSLTFRYVNKLT